MGMGTEGRVRRRINAGFDQLYLGAHIPGVFVDAAFKPM
jgi:hypothetical protein